MHGRDEHGETAEHGPPMSQLHSSDHVGLGLFTPHLRVWGSNRRIALRFSALLRTGDQFFRGVHQHGERLGTEGAVGATPMSGFLPAPAQEASGLQWSPPGAPMCPLLVQLEKVLCWTTLAESPSSAGSTSYGCCPGCFGALCHEDDHRLSRGRTEYAAGRRKRDPEAEWQLGVPPGLSHRCRQEMHHRQECEGVGGKLKDVMYEATDIFELCQLEAMERPQERPAGGGASNHSSSFGGYMKKKLQGCFQPLLFCLLNPVFAHETGSRIKKLNEELDTIRKDATKLNFINISSYQEQRKLTNPAHLRNKTTAGFNKLEAVGENIEEDADQLVQKLITQDGRDFKVVAIVGQGGMGKSFLAKKIFASEDIKEEFRTKIWLSVTQHFDKVELLRSAITHAEGKHNEEKDESILEQTLTEALSTNKFLLVLDDIWSDTAWKDFLHVPVTYASCTQPGSQVLVTSRKEDAVRRMGASSHDLLRVRKLEDEDAWSLLKKQLPLPEEKHGRFAMGGSLLSTASVPTLPQIKARQTRSSPAIRSRPTPIQLEIQAHVAEERRLGEQRLQEALAENKRQLEAGYYNFFKEYCASNGLPIPPAPTPQTSHQHTPEGGASNDHRTSGASDNDPPSGSSPQF